MRLSYFIKMKLRPVIFLCLLLLATLIARSSDYFLLPENFFMHKGETLNLHLFIADFFDKEKNVKYDPATVGKFALYEGSKPIDLKGSVTPTDTTLLHYKMQSAGLYLAELTQTLPGIDLDRGAFIRELDDEGLTKLSEKANTSYQQDMKEKYTGYLKTLFSVDKASGNIFNKDLGHELEIIPMQNPYKLNYGDDITVLVKFRGKPFANAHVDLYVKSLAGKVFAQRLISDASGNIFFKLNREGNYLLRTVNIDASKLPGIDYEKWAAAFTFGFRTALLKSY